MKIQDVRIVRCKDGYLRVQGLVEEGWFWDRRREWKFLAYEGTVMPSSSMEGAIKEARFWMPDAFPEHKIPEYQVVEVIE